MKFQSHYWRTQLKFLAENNSKQNNTPPIVPTVVEEQSSDEEEDDDDLDRDPKWHWIPHGGRKNSPTLFDGLGNTYGVKRRTESFVS